MKKLQYLEGLRGIAAVVVVFSHFVQMFYPALLTGYPEMAHHPFEGWLSKYPANLLYNGNFSVCLFFVLSGYVLSFKFFKYKDGEILFSGAVKRYVRLAVPVFASVCFAWALLQWDAYYYDDIRGITRSNMEDPYAGNAGFPHIIKLGFGDVFIHGDSDFNPVLWTMRYELVGSYIIFALLALFGHVKKRYIVYFLYAAIIAGLAVYIDLYYTAFILGLFLSDLHNNYGGFPRTSFFRFAVLLLFASGLFFGSFPYIYPVHTMYGYLLIPVPFVKNNAFVLYHIAGAFLLMWSVLNADSAKKALSRKLFRFLGKLSFSLYLTHFIILCSFSAFLFSCLVTHYSYHASFAATFFLSWTVMLPVSYVIYKYADSTAIRLGEAVYRTGFAKVYGRLFPGLTPTEAAHTLKGDDSP